MSINFYKLKYIIIHITLTNSNSLFSSTIMISTQYSR